MSDDLSNPCPLPQPFVVAKRKHRRDDDQLLFRELLALLQGDRGRARFCAAILGNGQAFLANENALRIAILATMPYRMYLLTEHWRAVSSAAKERAGNRCQLCNGNLNLETHHRTYERRGFEEPSDLTVLCSDCHGKYHMKLTPDEMAEPAAVDPVEMKLAGMTPEEEVQWLTQLMRQKRIEQGIKPDGSGRIETATEKPISSILRQKRKS